MFGRIAGVYVGGNLLGGSPFDSCGVGFSPISPGFLAISRLGLVVRGGFSLQDLRAAGSLFMFDYFANLTFISTVGLGHRGVALTRGKSV